ncbi:urease subunit alpha [Nocardioides sp. YIM 152315]|uniref:urease subunit alpha n=1 Tax=Nocardioides sp. YIM 152315 TaxID=3031760 RepID=UPI0023DB7016|nr:urease subunit alpha [Nocardioides sp. YIM 152315]MDF1603218.1 urease subunit alpha [Nocardioides sp. YIM 152315]
MSWVPRTQYASLYGPTVGDRFRLADTALIAQVERSLITPGEEAVYGGGKSLRDGMGQMPGIRNADGALDLVITSVIVMDALIGIVKADIGIRDGRVVGIGQAGNPLVQDGVHPDLIVGAGTEVISGEGLVATAGAVDSHAHFITPAQVPHALSSGVTTLLGGGTGPADGSKGTTCTPGPWNLARMLEASAGLPVNVGFFGKGNSSRPEVLIEQLAAGACGLKVHEDWGATPATIDCALSVADEHDVQVALHADTLNEGGHLADTVAAIDGRAIHSYHTEGAGGGHAPDVMAIAELPNVLPSSTNPTRPYTTDTTDNLFDMIVVTHHLNPNNPEDVAFAQSRIRAETEAAEDVLHDLGVLSMYSSDSQAMGRVGDTVATCWRTADKMKKLTGALAADPPANDNQRILRYLAKLTINPALAHGIGHLVGSLEPGKVADIVLWPTSTFGVKPKYVIKSGFVAWAVMGDGNASIPTPEPVLLGPMFGALGSAVARTSMTFMSKAAVAAGVPERVGLDRWVEPVRNCRTVGKEQMVRNSAMPSITVDTETYQVHLDGVPATVRAVDEVSMAQLYYIV